MVGIARRAFLEMGLVALAAPAWARRRTVADVLVYGATASGVMAAIAAAREGSSVILLEASRHVGGMLTGGLSATDKGNVDVIGGLTRAFFVQAGRHYGLPVAWQFEPSLGSAILKEWLRDHDVIPLLGDPAEGVELEGREIRRVRCASGAVYEARTFIDASYEGDLMALAGVKHIIGREGRDTYGEQLAGRLEFSVHDQFWTPVNPYDAAGNLLPLVGTGDSGTPGAGDHRVQSYNYRICVSSDAANRLSFPQPPGYDSDYFALLARYLQNPGKELSVKDILMPVGIHGSKLDLNNNGPISTDYLGASDRYPNAGWAERARIAEAHRRYNLGFLYFIANDRSVPARLRDELNQWGLARDEFATTGNFPPQLYVREARRLIGDYVMTQRDVQSEIAKPDSIGMGSFPIDSHHFQRIASPVGAVINEGFMVTLLTKPYQLPYRCMTPKRGDCSNLLVTICCSASHVAYSTIRMEPQYMILGEAAGIAAAQAARSRAPVQSVDVTAVRARLASQGQVLQH
jgi:hypothetical protein